MLLPGFRIFGLGELFKVAMRDLQKECCGHIAVCEGGLMSDKGAPSQNVWGSGIGWQGLLASNDIYVSGHNGGSIALFPRVLWQQSCKFLSQQGAGAGYLSETVRIVAQLP